MRAFILSCLILSACGKKAATPEAAAAPKEAALTAEMPDSAEAKAFAKRLVKAEIVGYSPTGNSQFQHNTLDFRGDGTWVADAILEAGGEEVPCAENGTWRIDAADSTDTATLELAIDKTSCPTRSDGTSWRINVTVDNSGSTQIRSR